MQEITEIHLNVTFFLNHAVFFDQRPWTKIFLGKIASFIIPIFGEGPFTHSIENAVIEASSTFHRSFIDFFVVMHENFDDATNFSMKYTFHNFFQKFYN